MSSYFFIPVSDIYYLNLCTAMGKLHTNFASRDIEEDLSEDDLSEDNEENFCNPVSKVHLVVCVYASIC
jgi:hypothetical protein